MKSIAIFCRSIDKNGHPFKSEYYWSAYLDLLLTLKERGAQAYFVTHGSYAGQGVFNTAFTADSKQPVEAFERLTDVKVDLVFDKGGFTGEDVMVLNPEYVHKLASSKLETFKHFGRYQPKTVVCASREELVKAARAMDGDRIVVKEPDEYVNGVVSNGGNFVYIGAREQVLAELPDRYPLMVQEFVDTSVGIENLVDGVHDVRVEIGGGEIWGGTLRTPPPGELKANVAQGGTRRRLFPDEIPAEARKLALEIDTYFANYPRHYSIDFAHTPQGWRLIELNNNPGLSPLSLSPQAQHITKQLADYLLKICS